MSMPAARITDMHVCPLVLPIPPSPIPTPHVGGPVITGAPTVLTGMIPQARVTDTCVCASPVPDVIVMGSPTVLVCGMPAARIGDMTAHGGTITTGLPTVLIGMGAGGGGGAGGGAGSVQAGMGVGGSGSADGSTNLSDTRGDPGGPMKNHSGAISTGEATAPESQAQRDALINAAKDGVPYCEACAQAAAAMAAADAARAEAMDKAADAEADARAERAMNARDDRD